MFTCSHPSEARKANFFLLCLMKINLVFCSLCSNIIIFVFLAVQYFFFFSFHFYSSRSTHNNHRTTNTRSLLFWNWSSQENSEFLHLNQNQLHQSSVNVGFSNIAYNPDSSRSGEVDEGTSTEKGRIFFLVFARFSRVYNLKPRLSVKN